MAIKKHFIIPLVSIVSLILINSGIILAAESPWQSLNPSLESGLSGVVTNCNPLTVANGDVAPYPSCAITCNSGYTLRSGSCVVASVLSGGGGISGGGGGGAAAGGTALIVGANGGSVSLAAGSNSPGVKFTAPAGSFGGAINVIISKIYPSSSAYIPPAETAKLSMVGEAAYQVTATSGLVNTVDFVKPINLTFTYTDAQVPAGVLKENLKIYHYNTDTGTWLPVASTVNSLTNTITANVNYLGRFAIYGVKAGAAATTDQGDKLALIAQIQATLNLLIAQLKTMVADMIAQGKYVSPSLMAFAPNAATTPTQTKITQGWSVGQSSQEIRAIQTILARDASVYPEGQITGYFGPATLAAIKRFQEKYDIAKPGDNGYGLLGPVTRAKLNAM